jgi:hypothetical protein
MDIFRDSFLGAHPFVAVSTHKDFSPSQQHPSPGFPVMASARDGTQVCALLDQAIPWPAGNRNWLLKKQRVRL